MTQQPFADCGVSHQYNNTSTMAGFIDGLRTIYRAEGTRGLYKGSLLALVGVSNGSIQFATYEEIKRRRTDIKRKLFASQGKEWKVEDEKLVSGRTYTVGGAMRCRHLHLPWCHVPGPPLNPRTPQNSPHPLNPPNHFRPG